MVSGTSEVESEHFVICEFGRTTLAAGRRYQGLFSHLGGGGGGGGGGGDGDDDDDVGAAAAAGDVGSEETGDGAGAAGRAVRPPIRAIFVFARLERLS